MSKLSSYLKTLTTPGTPLCALVYALIGAVLAVLLLTVGFWKTLFIALFAAVGALLGGIADKKNALRSTVNRCFPPKYQTLTDEQLQAALHREATTDINSDTDQQPVNQD